MGTDYSFPLFYTCPMVNGEDRTKFGQLQPTTCFVQTPSPSGRARQSKTESARSQFCYGVGTPSPPLLLEEENILDAIHDVSFQFKASRFDQI